MGYPIREKKQSLMEVMAPVDYSKVRAQARNRTVPWLCPGGWGGWPIYVLKFSDSIVPRW